MADRDRRRAQGRREQNVVAAEELGHRASVGVGDLQRADVGRAVDPPAALVAAPGDRLDLVLGDRPAPALGARRRGRRRCWRRSPGRRRRRRRGSRWAGPLPRRWWPRLSQSFAASRTASTHSGSRRRRGEGRGGEGDAQRAGIAADLVGERLGRRIAANRDRPACGWPATSSSSGAVAHRAGDRVAASRSRPSPRPSARRRRGPATASARTGRSRRPGCGSSRRRRWRGRPARCPAATAAAAPPDEPPDVRPRSHGLRVGPNIAGSVTGSRPSSGVLVLPKMIRPAAL